MADSNKRKRGTTPESTSRRVCKKRDETTVKSPRRSPRSRDALRATTTTDIQAATVNNSAHARPVTTGMQLPSSIGSPSPLVESILKAYANGELSATTLPTVDMTNIFGDTKPLGPNGHHTSNQIIDAVCKTGLYAQANPLSRLPLPEPHAHNHNSINTFNYDNFRTDASAPAILTARHSAGLRSNVSSSPTAVSVPTTIKGFLDLPKEIRFVIYDLAAPCFQKLLPDRIRGMNEPAPRHYNYLKDPQPVKYYRESRPSGARGSRIKVLDSASNGAPMPYQGQHLMIKSPLMVACKQVNEELYWRVEYLAALHGGEVGASVRNLDFGNLNRYFKHIDEKKLPDFSKLITIEVHMTMSDPSEAALSTSILEHLDLVKILENKIIKPKAGSTVDATANPVTAGQVQAADQQVINAELNFSPQETSILRGFSAKKKEPSKKTKRTKSVDTAPELALATQNAAEAVDKESRDQVQPFGHDASAPAAATQGTGQLFKIEYFLGDMDYYETNKICDALNSVREALPEERWPEFRRIFDAFDIFDDSALGGDY